MRRLKRIERHLDIYESDERDVSNPDCHGEKHGSWYGMSRSAYCIHGVRVGSLEWESYKNKQEVCDNNKCECHGYIGKNHENS